MIFIAARASYAKAAECLDRAAEVDPYESGHMKRLEMLKGKVDDARYRAIAARFTQASKAPEEPAHEEGPTLGASTLQDLMLQAEILVQYGMRNKAVERLQRIQELFPREEERNEDLQRLYMSAGSDAAVCGGGTIASGGSAGPSGACGASCGGSCACGAAGTGSGDGCTGFTRVAEISRKLYHQGTAPAVLNTAVREIATHWEATRCIAAMFKGGLSATAVEEFCAEGLKKSSPASIAELVGMPAESCRMGMIRWR